jgi:hypothetical protein
VTRVRKGILALGALLVILAVIAVAMPNYTPVPPQYQMDFLAIASAAETLRDDVTKKATPITQSDLASAIAASGGLLRSAELISPRAIQVGAMMAPRSEKGAKGGARIPVVLRFEEVQGADGKPTKRCLGSPREALPVFCGAL